MGALIPTLLPETCEIIDFGVRLELFYFLTILLITGLVQVAFLNHGVTKTRRFLNNFLFYLFSLSPAYLPKNV